MDRFAGRFGWVLMTVRIIKVNYNKNRLFI
jgi:hypothetical protein